MNIPYYILNSNSHEIPVDLVGGKASNLLWLKKAEVDVPSFFVVTTESFRYFQQHHDLPSELKNALHSFLESHKKNNFAVRSSVTGEDGSHHSFAGLFETFLNCSSNDVIKKIKEAYLSIDGPRVLEYLKTKNIQLNLSMALVVQVMSHSVKSGVAFSRSPVSPTSVIVIDAGRGLGEGVVSGHTDVETIKLTRLMEVIHKHGPSILDETQIKSITQICLKLERLYKTPCDIEWSIDEEDKLNILQIRPITQAFRPLKALADTNLTESYPGIVSPFTALFVKKSYENVFIESAIALGASKDRLSELSVHYAQLIASVDYHLYYDLEHYYAILRALPGGDKNIDNWHRMIGGKLDFSYIPVHGTPLSAIESAQSVFSILKFIVFHKSIFSKLISDLENNRNKVESTIQSFQNANESLSYLADLIETRFDFGLTIVNDVLIMMGLGILKKRLAHLSESDLMSLLKTKDEVTSVKPLHALNALARELNKEVIERLTHCKVADWLDPYKEFYTQELINGNRDAVSAIQNFLNLYGDRSFEELKLESFTFKQSPQLLGQTIQWMKNQDHVSSQSLTESSLNIELSFFDKKVLHMTQKAIEMRETTRMWRGKFYNLMREALIKSAALLKEQDLSWGQFDLKDFFSINHLEWKDYSQGKLSKDYLQDLMKTRESWKNQSKKAPEFLIWDIEESLPEIQGAKKSGPMTGVGVSMGKVSGKCLVIEKPEEAFEFSNINEYILITKNTDPAWVFIMSKSLGLISEKGSLLSHTAIIGRELNIPTIVGVSGITNQLKTGDRIEMDPFTGIISKL